jgi:hypothetical protein
MRFGRYSIGFHNCIKPPPIVLFLCNTALENNLRLTKKSNAQMEVVFTAGM